MRNQISLCMTDFFLAISLIGCLNAFSMLRVFQHLTDTGHRSAAGYIANSSTIVADEFAPVRIFNGGTTSRFVAVRQHRITTKSLHFQ